MGTTLIFIYISVWLLISCHFPTFFCQIVYVFFTSKKNMFVPVYILILSEIAKFLSELIKA